MDEICGRASYVLLAKISAGAGSDLFRVARAHAGTTVRTFIVAAAGPGVLPDGAAAIHNDGDRRAPVTAMKLESSKILEGGAMLLRYAIQNADGGEVTSAA